MKSSINLDDMWAEAHSVYFNTGHQAYAFQGAQYPSAVANSPNKQLLNDNSFFAHINSGNEKIYIMHVTGDMDNINESQALYPSAGCLVGCIYGTQLYEQGDGKFLMHNLGEYILTKEARIVGRMVKPIIIEVSFNRSDTHPVLSGLDYLKLGAIHYTIYEQLRYLLSPSEQFDLESRISAKIRNSLDFIDLCYHISKGDRMVSVNDFFGLLNRTVPKLAIVGYIYFEALAEYTMLYSNDNISISLRDRGEFNNMIYKEFLIDVYEKIGRFKLSDFNLTINDLAMKLEVMRGDKLTDLRTNGLLAYIMNRVAEMVVDYLFTHPEKCPKWSNIEWNYRGFTPVLAPLVGHTIHRELRNFNRYKDFYFYFDQFKALSAWNYWNKMNIALPFNGPIQKGEIGINPAYQNAKYRIFTGVLSDSSSSQLIIDRERPDIDIIPRLIDLRHTVMRSRDHNERNGKNDRSGS